MELDARIEKIKLLILDVDGVLTDGRIIYDSKGCDSKFFDVHDGLGVYLLKEAGIKTVCLRQKLQQFLGIGQKIWEWQRFMQMLSRKQTHSEKF